MKLALTAIASCLAASCLGQLTLSQANYARVIVPEGTNATVNVRGIVIDTLIMDNKSSLRFTASSVSMKVKSAFIGKKVTWKASGAPGIGTGANGTDGSKLVLDIVFHKLGQLTIDTRGGQGTTGEVGRVASYGGSPENGKRGGNGGDGGDIDLRHHCVDFTPVFNRGSKNAIILKYKGGSGGAGGSGGSAYGRYSSSNSRPGEQGDRGRDGQLTLQGVLQTPPLVEGIPRTARPELTFNNLSTPTSKYNLFIEMLSGVAGALNQPNRTTHLFKALKDLDSSMKLGLVLENKKYESLSVTIPGKATFKLIEAEASSEEVSALCEYVKPLIEHKLDSVRLGYNYPEFITDFVLTSIDNAASLVSKEILMRAEFTNSSLGFTYAKHKSGAFQINGVSSNSQAFKTGFRRGDNIVTIKGIPTSYLGGGAFYKLVELDSGQSTAVSVERNGQISDKTLVGEWAQKRPLTDKMERISDDVLYLRVSEFSSGKERKIRTFIRSQDKFNDIILDLRDCPGGLLSEATDIASIFLDYGDTVAIVDFAGRASPEYYLASSHSPMKPRKVLILTNENTASGAEIIVAALTHNKAAQTIGLTTYGLGEIKQQLPIDFGRYIARIKAGELYTPAGVAMSSAGLQPDFRLESDVDIIQFSLDLLRKN